MGLLFYGFNRLYRRRLVRIICGKFFCSFRFFEGFRSVGEFVSRVEGFRDYFFCVNYGLNIVGRVGEDRVFRLKI